MTKRRQKWKRDRRLKKVLYRRRKEELSQLPLDEPPGSNPPRANTPIIPHNIGQFPNKLKTGQ